MAFIGSVTQSGIRSGDVKPGVSVMFSVVFKNLGEIGGTLLSRAGGTSVRPPDRYAETLARLSAVRRCRSADRCRCNRRGSDCRWRFFAGLTFWSASAALCGAAQRARPQAAVQAPPQAAPAQAGHRARARDADSRRRQRRGRSRSSTSSRACGWSCSRPIFRTRRKRAANRGAGAAFVDRRETADAGGQAPERHRDR